MPTLSPLLFTQLILYKLMHFLGNTIITTMLILLFYKFNNIYVECTQDMQTNHCNGKLHIYIVATKVLHMFAKL